MKPKQHKAGKPMSFKQGNVPTEGSKEEFAAFGRKWLSKSHDVKAYQEMIAAERERYAGDWNNASEAYFRGLRGKA